MATKTRDKNDGNATQDDSNDGSSPHFQKTVKNFRFLCSLQSKVTVNVKPFFPVFLAIVKRYDVFTLQTADGICVCIRGFINKQQTIENGFSSEVFTRFYFGFPPDWEKYAKECLGETISGSNSSNAARDSDPCLVLTPSNLAGNSSTMVEERTNLDSSRKKDKDSTIKVQDEQNLKRNTPISLPSKLNHVKEHSPRKETRRKLDLGDVASPASGKRKGTRSISSPTSLNLKRSRSGRVLLPPMEFWRNQIPVYDQVCNSILAYMLLSLS
ncbi:hypothetical protein V6N12_030685 [Hibiscus sabdariffa]|uniref:SANTA domain-containing protein n=1 Tax=Hibiscus sabdariffa TaxID=183260 RepID=A0ABR2E6Q5_9ROSI